MGGPDFLPADRLAEAGSLIESLAAHTDVYIGIALRHYVLKQDPTTGRKRQVGDKSSVSHSHLAWADLDREDAQSVIEAFPHRPTMTVACGFICSRRARLPGTVDDGCWRRVADTARTSELLRWSRRPR
jgi:hypothetical protein